MEITSLIYFILIGIVAGWLAGKIMKGGGFGLLGDLIIGVLGDLIIGVLGALLGGFVFGLLGLHLSAGLIGSLVTATVGAILLLFLLRLVKR